MSSRRSIVWLLFFIALAVGAHVLVSSRAGRTVIATRPSALVAGADRATLIEFSRPQAPAVVAIRSDRWKLIAPFPASVNAEALLRVLDALAFSPVTDVLSEQEMRRLGRTPKDFGLESPALRLAVRRDERETAVRFGRPTPGGDGVYASLSGAPGVCVVSTNVLARVDLSLDALRDPRLVAGAEETVSVIDIRRAPGKFVRVNRAAAAETWRMSEPMAAPVSATRVNGLVKMLSDARALRFVWPVAGEQAAATPSASTLAGYGFDADAAVTVTLSDPTGANRTVSFGAAADGDTVYALVQNGGAIVTVPVALRDRLLAAAESFVDLKLFPFEEKEIGTLSIADGDLVYLAARAPDGAWRLDSPVSAPADPDVVRSLIRTVLSLRTTERDPNGLVVSVSTNAPAVAVARDALLVQNRLEDLRSKTLLKIPSDRIRRLSVTFSEGRHEAVSWDAAGRTWLLGKPEGGTLNGLALAGVLGALDPLVAQSIVRLRISASEAGNYGLERPRFTIAVDQAEEGAIRRNVLIGAAAPGGGHYATVGTTDAVVILSDETVRALTASFSASE